MKDEKGLLKYGHQISDINCDGTIFAIKMS